MSVPVYRCCRCKFFRPRADFGSRPSSGRRRDNCLECEERISARTLVAVQQRDDADPAALLQGVFSSWARQS